MYSSLLLHAAPPSAFHLEALVPYGLGLLFLAGVALFIYGWESQRQAVE